MSLSAPFIRRPVATPLLTFGVMAAGTIAFFQLPVSPLPQVDFPTISVRAQLPGASPEVVATSVATPLERHLGEIADVTEMTSSSTVGATRINKHDRPLALYWFGKDDAARDEVLARTISGGVTVNDCLFHFTQINQPMGGVGASGTGAYHGEWGFKTLSKLKPVFYRSALNRLADLYPPYGAKIARLERMLRFMS